MSKRHDPDDDDAPSRAGASHAIGAGVIAALLGILFTLIATLLQGGSLVAYQRQAAALEDISLSLRTGCRPAEEPSPTPSHEMQARDL